ncbi:MAG: hypothetical protein IKX58_07665 [Clostridia bacterium]|nr:hypothetical protein [Clostridia bacterium]
MKQLKYVFSDFVRNKRVNLFFLIQMIVVFLLVGLSANSIISTMKGYRAVAAIRNAQAYILSDCTPDDRFRDLMEASDENEPKLHKLLNFIKGRNIEKTYSQYSYIVDEFNGLPVLQYTANSSFFEIFGLTCNQGRDFIENDYALSADAAIPIIVGYGLRTTYSLGETYPMRDAGTGMDIHCKVIGVLPRGASFYDFHNLNNEIFLDYSYIKPMQDGNVEAMSFSDVDMAISSSVFFTSNVDEVRSVQQKSKELGLFDYKVSTPQEQIQWFFELMKERNLYLLSIAAIIVIFAAIGMSTNLSLIISKSMREYSIHILCGGRYIDIAKRLFMQMLILMLIALIPTAISIGLSTSLIVTAIFAVIISVAIMTTPIVKLYSMPINRLLKEGI